MAPIDTSLSRVQPPSIQFLYRLHVFSSHPTDVTKKEPNVTFSGASPTDSGLFRLRLEWLNLFFCFFCVTRVTCENTQDLSATFNPL